MASATPAYPPRRGKSPALWGGVIGAPAAWAVQLQVGYALAPYACGDAKTHLLLHLVTIVTALLALYGGYVSWAEWRGAGGGSPDGTAGDLAARGRFLGALGMAVSGFAVVVILAQGIASFFFEDCWI